MKLIETLNEAENNQLVLYYVIYNPKLELGYERGPFLTRSDEIKGYDTPRSTFNSKEEAERTLKQWKAWAKKKFEQVETEINRPGKRKPGPHDHHNIPGRYWGKTEKEKRNPYVDDLKKLRHAKIGVVKVDPL